MVLKKPTKEQYEALFGPLDGQIRVVLVLAFEDSGERMFANEASASWRKFCEVVDALKKLAEKDVEQEVFATPGLTCLDVFVREVEELFKIADGDARYERLKQMVRSKMRMNGCEISDEEYNALPYSDQIIAINKAVKDITGDSKTPLSSSAKE